MSRLRTPEEVCVEYAEAVADVRRLTKKIGTCECLRSAEWNKKWERWSYAMVDNAMPVDPQPTTCLYDLWHLPQGPEGEVSDEYVREAMAEMCSPCSEAYEYIQTRKKARSRVGAAKRSVEAIGKRVLKEKA